jgi:hypothetical protein
MPSYIPQRIKRSKQQITVKLFQDQLAMLDSYGRFIDDSRDYVISQALELVFKKDKEFSDWLEQQPASAPSSAERIGPRNAVPSAPVQPGPQAAERAKRLRPEPQPDSQRQSA